MDSVLATLPFAPMPNAQFSKNLCELGLEYIVHRNRKGLLCTIDTIQGNLALNNFRDGEEYLMKL